MDKKNKKIGSVLGLSIFFSIIAGGLAGVIGAVNVNESLNNYTRSLEEDTKFVTLSEIKPRPLPGTYEESLSRVREVAFTGVATVRAVSKDTKELSLMIKDDSMLGAGAVVTNDGWIVFNKISFKKFTNPLTEAEVWIGGNRFAITNYVEDTLTDLVMVKIESKNLTSLAFGTSTGMNSGDLLFAIQNDQSVIIENIKNYRARVGEVADPAEFFTTNWELENKNPVGAPLFNTLAELVGISTGEGGGIPLHQILPFIRSTIRDGVGSRAGLGVRVVEIDSTLNIDESLLQNMTAGALVLNESEVLAKSPAELAGLEAGDIIISVDNKNIEKNMSLAELIALHEVGDRGVLTVLRSGALISLEVTFTDFKDLKY
ncbi:hypothetical protein COY25_02230 [Candidatus Uhrbacteria bacterium CG_4_10_14_0_2_um_filter_41_7]|uniref:PDZ domain-containing protein n=1 Tax=Candidatus Uhrbacteria bacterium CG_4_9_14_3_um_filter_41_35 TaxID=1975034 RepID=A0A2M7XFL9_9BACT|nr:MAG: hypothetical protein COV92_00765 [Candidatus Uhrbacteria bacterium CG11_big_fil_rev_8_21_14_0_20_41_9]PIZ54337.1 MAG: hypothetical protein COY25_02230 [Candidatus Uhrbacteria bacterium CG_4_10_14_0_2_um_filter_41_7]PJA46690.1 MAG: hypothetical protein CO173_02895 [Candidatus Uhrbacteria bacterium CG_4_9_14_3_um_filter_41_35]